MCATSLHRVGRPLLLMGVLAIAAPIFGQTVQPDAVAPDEEQDGLAATIPVPPALAVASRQCDELAAEAPLHAEGNRPVLTFDRWCKRHSAKGNWFGWKRFRQTVGGPHWPEPEIRPWAVSTFQPIGFDANAEAEVREILASAERDPQVLAQAWDRLWEDTAVPAVWKRVRSYVTDSPPNAGGLSYRDLSDLQASCRLAAASTQSKTATDPEQPPAATVTPDSARAGGVRDGISNDEAVAEAQRRLGSPPPSPGSQGDGALVNVKKNPVGEGIESTRSRPAADWQQPPVPTIVADSVQGALRRLCDHWNQLCRLASTPPFPPAPAEGQPAAPAAQRVRDALTTLDAIVATYGEVVAPVADIERRGLSHEALRQKLEPVRKVLDELLALMAFSDEFENRRAACQKTVDDSLRSLKDDVATIIDPDSTEETVRGALDGYEVHWRALADSLWELAVLHRRSIDFDRQLVHTERALKAVLARYVEDYLAHVGEAVGARLGHELAQWDTRNGYLRADLRTTPSPRFSGPAGPLPAPAERVTNQIGPMPVVRWLISFYETAAAPHPEFATIDAPTLPKGALDEQGRIQPEELTQERLAQLCADAWSQSGLGDDKPVKIEVFAHRLKFSGPIQPSKLFARPAGANPKIYLLVVATEIDCGNAQLFLNDGAELGFVTHRLTGGPPPGALQVVPPFFGVGAGSRVVLYVSQPGACSDLVELATGDPFQTLSMASQGRDTVNAWGPLYQTTQADNVARRLDEFWITAVHQIRSLLETTPDIEKKRAFLQELGAIPRTVQNTAATTDRVKDEENAARKAYVDLFGDRTIVVDDPETGAHFPCLSTFKNGRQTVYLLPDEVVVANRLRTDGKLGDVYLASDGWEFGLVLTPRLSPLASTRGLWLARQRFPGSEVESTLPLEDYRLSWGPCPALNAMNLESGPTGIAMARETIETSIRTRPLSGSGIETFFRFVSAPPEMSRDARCASIQVQRTHSEESLDRYRCPIRFDRVETLPLEVTMVSKTKDGGRSVALSATCNKPCAAPIRVTGVVGREGLLGRLAGGPVSVPVDGREVRINASFAETQAGEVRVDATLDLTGRQPFDLFAVGEGVPLRKVEVPLNAVKAARYPSEDGQAGSGRWIDLRRSRLVVAYLDPETGRRVPGQVLYLEQLGRRYPDWLYEFLLYGSYKSEVTLELFRTLDPGDTPDKITFKLPYEENGTLFWRRQIDVGFLNQELAKARAPTGSRP